jgi:hypothetical protein
VAQLTVAVRPARVLERMGLPGAAARARLVRADAAFLWDTVRPAWAARATRAWVGEPAGRREYRVLSEEELRATRRSDTAFVFGSGGSLRDIGDDEWRRIAECDVVGFSHFHRQQWVDVGYHLVAEIRSADETGALIAANPRYRDTIFLVMRGWVAEASNELVARRLLPRGARIFRWRRVARGLTVPPSDSLSRGLVHGSNTSLDVVNFALLMGWRRVVVAGVDLYDKEYFFLPPGVARPDERPQFGVDSRFHQADHVIEMFGLWRRWANERGIELSVYNPRSLLAEVLPVFSWSTDGAC